MRRTTVNHAMIGLLLAGPFGAAPALAEQRSESRVISTIPIHCAAAPDLCGGKLIPGAGPIPPTFLLPPPSAAARVKIELFTKADPCAEENVTRRAKTPRTGSTMVRDEQPLPFEGCAIRCAGASELCAWNRIPDPRDGGFEAPLAPQ
jgi:hypothetical protein